MKQQTGLTLVELLIAITVSAVLALYTLSLVSSVTDGRRRLEEANFHLDQLQRAESRIETDILELDPERPVKDDYGQTQNSIIANFETFLTFTRKGWSQSLLQLKDNPRSQLQRVSYELAAMSDERCSRAIIPNQRLDQKNLEGYCLIRAYYFHLEHSSYDDPKEVAILGYVKSLDFEFVYKDSDSNLVTTKEWPPAGATGDERPVLIKMTLEHQKYGEITREWLVPQGWPKGTDNADAK
ncbi:type II secretion system protein GspJ [Gynuella sunshinyii]|uniref:Type II secretion system protein J n=1 Tax=Gynuella sunshinyii YC6258 TaxID=1445510 RepID=A0A0C5VNI3_9GAMM|nr:type II secretion system protein GspJ [Gynuella sunshinyii]AJQ95871.1 type II secretory pathway, component PulJ [Gynuella sunshinyii YC6258]